MSITLTTAAQKLFDADVKQAFQQMGLLDSAVTIRRNVKGSQYQFNKIGKGMANQKAIHESVTAMDVAHTQQVATLTKWFAPEYTDYFSNQEAPFDERVELVNVIAGALGRRKDQLILDAIRDSVISYASGKKVGVNIGGSNTDLNVEKIIDAGRILDDAGVPADGRIFIGHTTGKAALMNTTKATSSDFTSVQALTRGQINEFYGFKFIWINTRDEGGLPKSGNTRENYAFHMSAVGLAVGDEVSAQTTWIAEKDAWLCNGKMRAGAVARDTDGMVLVSTYEA